MAPHVLHVIDVIMFSVGAVFHLSHGKCGLLGDVKSEMCVGRGRLEQERRREKEEEGEEEVVVEE